MNVSPGNRTPSSIIPREIAAVFDELDIDRTWDYLEKTFHLNKKKWKADFEQAYVKATREISKVELFVRYGREKIQPLLNQLLFRDPKHPTWFMLIRYIVKDKIKKEMDRQDMIMNEYGRNSAYKTYNRKY